MKRVATSKHHENKRKLARLEDKAKAIAVNACLLQPETRYCKCRLSALKEMITLFQTKLGGDKMFGRIKNRTNAGAEYQKRAPSEELRLMNSVNVGRSPLNGGPFSHKNVAHLFNLSTLEVSIIRGLRAISWAVVVASEKPVELHMRLSDLMSCELHA